MFAAKIKLHVVGNVRAYFGGIFFCCVQNERMFISPSYYNFINFDKALKLNSGMCVQQKS